ncbi:MAG: flagellar basal body rod protein FlgB [Pyrinomonadaceae bacterium]
MELLPGTDRISSLLTKFLDVQSRRAEVVAGNLANADTPGFAAKELDFEEFLDRAAKDALAPRQPVTGKGVAALLFEEGPRVVEQETGAVGLDGNNVDTGREMSTLAEVGVKHLTGTQILQLRLRTLRSAIREGR